MMVGESLVRLSVLGEGGSCAEGFNGALGVRGATNTKICTYCISIYNTMTGISLDRNYTHFEDGFNGRLCW